MLTHPYPHRQRQLTENPSSTAPSRVITPVKHPSQGYQLVTPDSELIIDRWNKSLTVTVDAEWSSELITQTLSGRVKDTYRAHFLTAQFSWQEEDRLYVLVIWHPDYELPETLNIERAHTVYIVKSDPETTTPYSLGMCGGKTDLKVLMFFALHDVRSLVGTDLLVPWLLGPDLAKGYESFNGYAGTIVKKRKLNGSLVSKSHGKLELIDVIGTTTAGMNLDAFHESVGIESPYKKLSNAHDKGHMQVWMKDDPATFLQYAVGDVLFLEEAMTARVSQVNDMVSKALGFNPNYIAPWLTPDSANGESRFPMSAGSLVSNTFEKWLEQDPTYNRVLTALLPFTEYHTKKGQQLFNATVLEPMTTGNPGTWKGQPRTHYDPAHPLTSLPNRDGWNSEDVLESYHPLSSSSVPAQVFYHSGRNSTGVLNAIVYGGRCVNERPDFHRITDVLDIDLNSCYGSALSAFDLPVGFPRVLKYASSDLKRMTLKQFLDKYGDELVENCYQIYVSGRLNFRQDLVASKIGVDEKDIIKKLFVGYDDSKEYDGGYTNDSLGRDIDKAHIPGEMVHLLCECIHSVITSDILNAIRNVSSNLELDGWMSLEVETATYYAASDKCNDIESFESVCSASTPMKFINTVPVTPNAWFPVPMSEFVGKFVDARKSCKKQSTAKGDQSDLLQNGIKLFVNTTYGCMASPFFRMGNAVMANNITAKARLGAWMMAKALGSVQSITDGGMYSYNGVRILNPTRKEGKRPSFKTLSSYSATNSHRCISVGPMFSDDFSEIKRIHHHGSSAEQSQFETDVLSHINRFWGHYNGMRLPFNIEHKYQNACDVASYDGSANYLMVGSKSKRTRNWEGIDYPYIFKCRGAKDYNGEPHSKELLLWAYAELAPIETLLLNRDGELQQATSKVNKLIQVTAYQRNHREYQRAGLLPSDSVDEVQVLRPNELYRLVDTLDEYRRREKQHNDYSRKHDKALDTLGYIGRQFGISKHTVDSKRGTLGRNFPTFYKEHL
jgi:hypothetical protein